jgi:diguanylate cyclase (GGDEF)-like protein/PAS domain S-box-containing protein
MIGALEFLQSPDESLIYVGTYSPSWITISVFLAILGSYAALNAAARIEHQHNLASKLIWILISALTLGASIWAMHFIGMLAFNLPCSIHYDPFITLISMIPGILASGIALGVAWQHGPKLLSLMNRSILLGAGIGTMHYTGMAAMRLEGFVRYDPSLFILSLLVAIALSYLALHVKQRLICPKISCNLLVAVIMGSAVSGMHYTAMFAAYFVRGDAAALPSSVFTTNSLAILVAITTIFLALTSLALATISKNREMTDQLKDSEERWKFALEGSGDGVWDWNLQTDNIVFSERLKEIIGFTEHEFPDNGAAFAKRIHPADKEHALASLQNYFTGKQQSFVTEYRLRCIDDSWKWILARGKLVSRDADGNPVRMIGTQTDITERKIAEGELRIAAIAFDSQEGIMVTDANNTILRVNRAFSEITGYSAEEVIGKNPRFLSSGRQDANFYSTMWKSTLETNAWSGEIWNRRKNGEIYPEYLSVTAVKNQDSVVTNYVATFNDISLSKAAENEIKHLAFYDPLTQLPNRRLLMDRLKQALSSSSRNDRSAALLFIDLDNFKTLNDTLGHNMGDLMLQQVANRLELCVSDSGTVARLGGDEFVVMLEDLSKDPLEAAAQTESIGERLLASLNKSYQLAGHQCHTTASIGATLFKNHEQKTEDLFKQADIAMYQAKKAGRNALRFFDPAMQSIVNARVILESELRYAISAPGQMILYYQAQIESSGRVIGAEVLLRWHHPQRGTISPSEFIPFAEESGLILPLGHWVLTSACQQLSAWATHPATENLTISVNISAKQLKQATFVDEVLTLIDFFRIKPSRLKLEITESMLLDNVDDIIDKMNTLKSRGIGFSMDDFGTGYSSLQYLKHLPLDQLKIDQSFIHDLAINSNDRAIVRTIIAMAESLKLSIIAEGVETEIQRQLLHRKGCTHFQGYLFGKPDTIEQFEKFLINNDKSMLTVLS